MGKRDYFIFVGLVFELVTLVVGMVYLGSWYDQEKGTKGLGVTIGAILAIIVWVIHLVKAFKQGPEQNKKEND